MRLCHGLLIGAVLVSMACHPGPIVGAARVPVGGTIAGIVTADSNQPLPGRKVTAINTSTGARYEATTAANGGYTIKVPEGTYRLEVETRAGETVAKQPDPTRVDRSDLDAGRNFVIAVKRGEPPA